MRLRAGPRQLEFPDWCFQHVVDLVERVEGLERILEDGLHLAPKFAELAAADMAQISASISHSTLCRRLQTKQQSRHGALPTPALTNDTRNQRPCRVDAKREIS